VNCPPFPAALVRSAINVTCGWAAAFFSLSLHALAKKISAKRLFHRFPGFCAGTVVGLGFMGQPYGICVPPGTTSQQATDVVVRYIDGHPRRIHEDFNPLAVEALRANWPCSLAGDREPLPVADVTNKG
jgi:hypothetical protein